MKHLYRYAHMKLLMLIFILQSFILFWMSALSDTLNEPPRFQVCVFVPVCSWRWENNVTPKGLHRSEFPSFTFIQSPQLNAYRDFLFQFRRDVRPVPPPQHKNRTLPLIYNIFVKFLFLFSSHYIWGNQHVIHNACVTWSFGGQNKNAVNGLSKQWNV